METWAASLANRNAQDDRNGCAAIYCRRSATALKDITLPIVMRWLDRMRAEGQLAPASMRHCLNLLSRFFSWAIERGHTTINPVKQIPTGKRPQQPHKRDTPWLADDAIVRQIIHALPEPVGLMFYPGQSFRPAHGRDRGPVHRRSDGLADGAIRVVQPCRPAKRGQGRHRQSEAGPAPMMPRVPGDWLAQRRGQRRWPRVLRVPCASRGGSHYRKEYIEGCWERVAEKLGLSLTWYQATRHSFVTRNLAAGRRWMKSAAP